MKVNHLFQSRNAFAKAVRTLYVRVLFANAFIETYAQH